MTLTADQHAARRKGVGCSELFAALGKDPRCSRVELYKRKLGEMPEPDLSDVFRVRMGTLLEPVVRQLFAEKMGTEVVVPQETLVHPNAPLVGHADGWLPARSEGAEFKVADKFEAEEFGEVDTDQVPIRYLVQCNGYLAVKPEAKRWHLGVLIGGNDFRTYVIERDPELIAALEAGAAEFWKHVADRTPPEPMVAEDVRILWPNSLRQNVIATPEIEAHIARLNELKPLIKAAEIEVDDIKMQVCAFMQENSELVTPTGELLATWRRSKDSSPIIDLDAMNANEPLLLAGLISKYPKLRSGPRKFLLK